MLIVLVTSPMSMAQTTPHVLKDDAKFSIVFENDLFGSTDQHYTGGVRIGYSPATRNYQPGFNKWTRGTGWFSQDSRYRITTSFGQNLYTPRDIKRAVPDPNDRPYAGWIYATLGLQVSESASTQSVESSVGMVGPRAGGRQSQLAIHEAFESDAPAGWDYQLANETTLQINYQRSDLAFESQWRGRIVTTSSHFSLALGNAFTYAGTGVSVRLGNSAGVDLGPLRIHSGVPGSTSLSYNTQWHLFASIEARAVARNLFLDGNTFKDGPSVEREPLVAEVQFGWGKKFEHIRVGYTQVIRSHEFTAQKNLTLFGALSISVNM